MMRRLASLILIAPLFLLSACGLWRAEPPADGYQLLARHTPDVAERYLGLPYRLGADPDRQRAADCSHLVSAIARNSLAPGGFDFSPGFLSTPDIEAQSAAIPRDALQPGDLVFFKNKGKLPWENHVGVITRLEGEKICFVHASSSQGVRESDTQSHEWRHYWQPRFHSFRRWKKELLSPRPGQDSISKAEKEGYTAPGQGWFDRLATPFTAPP